MSKAIMIQGTGSGVGKSVLCAALCRIFFRDGLRVAPFKTQNMSLNSFVTKDGLEMARSQVVQAEAAGIEPEIEMNPLLLKPHSDTGSQVILNGRVIGESSGGEYGRYAQAIGDTVLASYRHLTARYDLIVIEGAGSPAEVNLKDRDIVNMRTAEMADAPVLLAADIDKGGVFASLVGTVELLDPSERERIKGFIINKFRGDRSLFASGCDFLLERTHIPVVGLVPYFSDVYIQEEDGMALECRTSSAQGRWAEIDIAVLRLPHISNFTDVDPLAMEPGVRIRYVQDPDELNGADALIIPGSKNTIGDLIWLRTTGFEERIQTYAEAGGMVVGICGGYQMLGMDIADPFGVDGSLRNAEGLRLLPISTVMEKQKQTSQVKARSFETTLWKADQELSGYEIHMGKTERFAGATPAFRVEGEGDVFREDGAVAMNYRVWGSYLHGLFENDCFRRNFLDTIRKRGRSDLSEHLPYHELKQQSFDRLADIVRASLDMEAIYAIIGR